MGATLYWTCDVPGCNAEARYVDVRRYDILPRLPVELKLHEIETPAFEIEPEGEG